MQIQFLLLEVFLLSSCVFNLSLVFSYFSNISAISTCLFLFCSQSDLGEEAGQSSHRSSVTAPQAQVPVKSHGQAPVQMPDQDKKISIVNGQMVIRSTQASGEEGIMIRPTTAGRGKEPGTVKQDHDIPPPGSTAPRSSPTQSSMQDQIKFQQNEALKR